MEDAERHQLGTMLRLVKGADGMDSDAVIFNLTRLVAGGGGTDQGAPPRDAWGSLQRPAPTGAVYPPVKEDVLASLKPCLLAEAHATMSLQRHGVGFGLASLGATIKAVKALANAAYYLDPFHDQFISFTRTKGVKHFHAVLYSLGMSYLLQDPADPCWCTASVAKVRWSLIWVDR